VAQHHTRGGRGGGDAAAAGYARSAGSSGARSAEPRPGRSGRGGGETPPWRRGPEETSAAAQQRSEGVAERALNPFNAESSGEVSVAKNDPLVALSPPENGWIYIRNDKTERVGWAPEWVMGGVADSHDSSQEAAPQRAGRRQLAGSHAATGVAHRRRDFHDNSHQVDDDELHSRRADVGSRAPRERIRRAADGWRKPVTPPRTPAASRSPRHGAEVRQIVAIEGRAAWQIDQVVFRFSDGSVWECGNADGGESVEPQRLDPGEFLTAVRQTYSGKFLGTNLVFETSHKRPLEINGYHKNKNFEPFEIRAPEGLQICGLKFEEGKLVDVVCDPAPEVDRRP